MIRLKTRNMKLVLLIVAVCFAANVYSFELKNRLNLKDSLNFAIDNNPAFKNINQEILISKLETKSSLAKNFPKLDFSTTYGFKNQKPNELENSKYSVLNLSLTETLYNNGENITNYEISKLKNRKIETEAEKQRNKLSLDIASAYIDYSLNYKLLEIQTNQFKILQNQYKKISNDYYQGIKSKKDYIRIKTEISRNEIEISLGKRSLEKSKNEILKLTGYDLSNPDKNSIIIEPISFDETILNKNFNLINSDTHLLKQIVNIQRNINDLESSIITKKNYPEINLTTGATYGSSDYWGTRTTFKENDKIDWNIMLNITYNIWDWGIKSRDAEIEIHKKIIQENESQLQLLGLSNELNELIATIEQNKINLKLAKELIELEKVNFDTIENEYRNGKITYLDLINGYTNFTSAQIKYFSSISSLQLNEFTYLFHQGKLYEYLQK